MTADELPAAFARWPAAWRPVPDEGFADAARAICLAVKAASGDRPIAPARPFRALELLAPEQVRVVLIGQDPYPTPGHADGLAFSSGTSRPHSLRRVMEVLAADRPGWRPPVVWCLDPWVRQGVLLLNAALTVEERRAGSHLGVGWQSLTSAALKTLDALEHPPAVLLWGRHAQAFFDSAVPQPSRWQVLRTRHPSHDFHRLFMAEGSHFSATADRVDWWALGPTGGQAGPPAVL